MRMTTPTDPASVDLDALDLTDPGFYSDGEPHAAWHALRERAPVRQYTNNAGIDYWVVTKFTDVENVLKNHRYFTAQRGNMLHMLGTEDPAGGHQMAVTDPPRHTKMRAPLTHALLMRSVEHRTELIRNLVLEIIEPWRSGEPFDFAEVMAGFPMAVSGDLMELPKADWPRLTHLTTCSIAADDLEFQLPEGPEETLRQAHRDLFSYFQSIVLTRRRDPGSDLISLLLTIEADGQRLTPSQVVSNCYSLLLGANVTTPQIANAALLHLIEQGSYSSWADQPELIQTGVEEALRWSSPASHFVRYATQPVTLRGVDIDEGDPVVVWVGSANRDADVFPDPYRFDVTRRPNKHLSFGSGPHYCVGHTVARIGLRLMFEEIFRHVESFELAGEVEHLRSNFVAGIKHLPVVARWRSA
jgi:cytochrome P450